MYPNDNFISRVLIKHFWISTSLNLFSVCSEYLRIASPINLLYEYDIDSIFLKGSLSTSSCDKSLIFHSDDGQIKYLLLISAIANPEVSISFLRYLSWSPFYFYPLSPAQ